ncbi:MAG TPA: exodeoxyribonuclease VII large subunit [Armatimonadota bacterium]|nr:exodeoxyribonuclease VII large subunit [Armatimonadota bacterium]
MVYQSDPFLDADARRDDSAAAPGHAGGGGPLTVREITTHVKQLIERSELLRDVEVVGEISNFTRHRSGHLYFSLKDEHSTLSCVCFRGSAQHLPFEPESGQRVVATGEVTVYEKAGRYQLLVRRMRPDGMGDLAAALEALKTKLDAEGLFDPSRKRQIPPFASAIALVTSATGAAVRDMVSVISRRWPMTRLVIIPTLVQGEGAPASIVKSIQRANTLSGIDIAIVGRGGGSLEDLWAFNDEQVARAIFASRLPIISAVGHETDTTIADLVADVRAPTPSAAGEIAVPDAQEFLSVLESVGPRLARALQGQAQRARATLDNVCTRPGLRQPERMLEEATMRVDDATRLLVDGARTRTERLAARLDALGGKLEALGPPAVLGRGYSITRRAADGAVVTSSTQVKPGEDVEVTLQRGAVLAKTLSTIPHDEEGTA